MHDYIKLLCSTFKSENDVQSWSKQHIMFKFCLGETLSIVRSGDSELAKLIENTTPQLISLLLSLAVVQLKVSLMEQALFAFVCDLAACSEMMALRLVMTVQLLGNEVHTRIKEQLIAACLPPWSCFSKSETTPAAWVVPNDLRASEDMIDINEMNESPLGALRTLNILLRLYTSIVYAVGTGRSNGKIHFEEIMLEEVMEYSSFVEIATFRYPSVDILVDAHDIRINNAHEERCEHLTNLTVFLHSMEGACLELESVRTKMLGRSWGISRHSARWLRLDTEGIPPRKDQPLIETLKGKCSVMHSMLSLLGDLYLPLARCQCGHPRLITGVQTNKAKAYLSRDHTSALFQFLSPSSCPSCGTVYSRPSMEVMISETSIPSSISSIMMQQQKQVQQVALNSVCICGNTKSSHYSESGSANDISEHNCSDAMSMFTYDYSMPGANEFVSCGMEMKHEGNSERFKNKNSQVQVKEKESDNGNTKAQLQLEHMPIVQQTENSSINVFCKARDKGIAVEAVVASCIFLYANIFAAESGETPPHFKQSVSHRTKFITRLSPYTIVQISSTSGIVEYVSDGRSLHDIKGEEAEKSNTVAFICACRNGECCPGTSISLKQHYLNTYESSNSRNAALLNFIRSLAPWCVCTYLLHVKDRHNGNILIKKDGQLLHVDYGFSLLFAPGGKFSLERNTPCYITQEMLQLMNEVVILEDGSDRVDGLEYFSWLLWRCFLSARRNRKEMETWLALSLSKVTSIGDRDETTSKILSSFRERHLPNTNEAMVTKDFVWKTLVETSVLSSTCCGYAYDSYGCYQSLANGIYR